MGSYGFRRVAGLEAGKDYRFAIKAIEEKRSKSGYDMLVVTLAPNAIDVTINHYLVKNENWDRNMTKFADAFGIGENEGNPMTWIGATGAARVKEDDYGIKVAWFLSKEQADKLPPWVGPMPERQTVTQGFAEVEDHELPF